MDYDEFIKKGARVICHHKVWSEVMWSRSGFGWIDKEEHCEIVSKPRYESDGRFANKADFYYYDDSIIVKLKGEDGREFTETLDKLEPDFAPAALSEEDLKTLWNEMSKGSIYYADYRNSVGVYEKTAFNYFEGYAEENWRETKEKFPNLSDEELEEKHWQTMSAEDFAYYCKGCEYSY